MDILLHHFAWLEISCPTQIAYEAECKQEEKTSNLPAEVIIPCADLKLALRSAIVSLLVELN